MRLILSTSLASVLAAGLLVVVSPQTADACSPINDRAEPPETELAYDASKSPAVPTVVEARILHHHDESSGCQSDTCGTIHSLSLTLDVDTATTLVRIDLAGRESIYAEVWDASSGTATVVILGFEHDDQLDLTVRALDDRGYLSQGVGAQAFREGQDPGCSASGTQSSALLLLGAIFLGLLPLRRRLRRA